jgi:glycine cleavage system regulatory protein
MTRLVITIVGQDRPGIVESLSATVADHGGNWLSSSMSNLAGQFAGIIEVAVDEAACDGLAAAIGALPGLQVHSVQGGGDGIADGAPLASIEVVGVDQPGIVRRLTTVLREAGVSLLEFNSWNEPAPHSGEELFRAVADFALPEELDLEALGARLEEAAEEMAVDIELALPPDEE